MFQTIAPDQRAEDHADRSMTPSVDDARADGLRHMQTEDQEGDEIEERRPGHRVARRENAASRRWWRSSLPRRAGR